MSHRKRVWWKRSFLPWVVGLPGLPVFRSFTTEDGRFVPDLANPAQGVVIDTEVRGGYPVLAGTRLPYDAVASLSEDGLTDTEIISLYPAATHDGITGARELAQLVAGAASAAA